MKLKKIKIIPLIIMCFLFNGCWDKIEIDNKIFISTIAVDVGKDIDKEKNLKNIKPNEVFKKDEFEKLNITFGFPDISESPPGKGGSVAEKSITTKAFSMESAINNLAAKTSRSTHFGHSKLLILSDELMEYTETVKEIIDYFNRQPNINRTMLVVVGRGITKKYLEFEPVMEKNIQSYITGIMENNLVNSSILPTDLNEVLISLYKDGSAVIPTIEFDKENKNQLNISGVALIKNYKLLGYLTSEETSSLEILRGKIRGGEEMIIENGHPIEFEITDIRRKINIDEDENLKKLKFKIDIILEGEIKQYYLSENIFSQEKLNKVEDNFNDAIERKCEKVARITQEEYSLDVIGIKDYLKKFKPRIYKQLEDNWENVYKNSIIDVSIDTKIRRIGITK